MAEQRLTIKDEVLALKRERIIEESRQLFFERGYQGTTLDAIADRLNVTKPFIYAHFDSKAAVLAEICQRGTRYALNCAEASVTHPGNARDRLAHLVERFTQVIYEHQANVAVYFREEKHVPGDAKVKIEKMQAEFDDCLSGLLQEGVDSAEFDVADVRLTSLAIGGMISWMFTWYRPHGRLSEEDLSAAMARLALKLVGAE